MIQPIYIFLLVALVVSVTIANPNSIPAKLREEHPDVVLLDMNFSSGINSGNEGLYWLREIKSLSPKTEVVLFTAYADIQLAVTGIKEGAADFIVKPFVHFGIIGKKWNQLYTLNLSFIP